MIEQTDRDAAADMFKRRDELHFASIVFHGHGDEWLEVQALAAHRLTAEQRGYDRAIAEVCAWLRADYETRVSSNRDYYLGLDDIANSIEYRHHQKGPQ